MWEKALGDGGGGGRPTVVSQSRSHHHHVGSAATGRCSYAGQPWPCPSNKGNVANAHKTGSHGMFSCMPACHMCTAHGTLSANCQKHATTTNQQAKCCLAMVVVEKRRDRRWKLHAEYTQHACCLSSSFCSRRARSQKCNSNSPSFLLRVYKPTKLLSTDDMDARRRGQR